MIVQCRWGRAAGCARGTAFLLAAAKLWSIPDLVRHAGVAGNLSSEELSESSSGVLSTRWGLLGAGSYLRWVRCAWVRGQVGPKERRSSGERDLGGNGGARQAVRNGVGRGHGLWILK